jgi:predicted GNAT family acetyltransferase
MKFLEHYLNEEESIETKLDSLTSKLEKNGIEVTMSYHKSGDYIAISRIFVPKDIRKQGEGTKIMEAIFKFADDNQLTIALSPSTDFGATSKNRLIDFYKRFGFVLNKGRHKDFRLSYTMYRKPIVKEETFDVGTPGKYDKKVFDKNYVNVNKDWWKGHKNPVSSNQKEIKEDNINDFIAKLQKELPKSWRWFQQIASLEDIIELVKKENSPIPIEKSKFKSEPDTYMDIKDVLKMKGEYDEKRKSSYDVDKGNMFGNYTFAEWYLFLKDIATHGIKDPIFIIKNKNGEYKISEGNHRIQALNQLGYKKIPVEIGILRNS